MSLFNKIFFKFFFGFVAILAISFCVLIASSYLELQGKDTESINASVVAGDK